MNQNLSYSDARLLTLLEDLESDNIERKGTWNGDAPEKARQAVCAFANDLPDSRKVGVLFVGVRDDGVPTGEKITDKLLLTLADMKTDGQILPPPTMVVQKRFLAGHNVAVVFVQPSDSPPVRYKGRVWIRTGPRRGVATVQDERILNEKRRHRDTAFEMHPVAGADLKELNRRLFEESYLPNAFANDLLQNDKRSYEERLAACGFLESVESPVPTVLGLLVLGHRPRNFVCGAYIQFLRIDGTALADPIIDEALIEGDLAQVVRRIDEKLASHNRVNIDIVSSATERRIYDYPMAALQQIVRNGVMHRTYESTNAPIHVHWFNDRIDIFSPGGPFGAVTAENFGVPGVVDYRNAHLADAMKVLGLVQRFGVGIQTAQAELLKNGNKRAEFAVDSTTVTCSMKCSKRKSIESKQPTQSPTQSPTRSSDPVGRIVRALKQGELSAGELRDLLGVKHRPTFRENYLHPALKQGLIEVTIPDKPTSRLQKYRLTDKGRGNV